MPCYSPLYAFRFMDKFGDTRIKFVSRDLFNDTSFLQDGSDVSAEKFKIPCGKCIGCRLEYSKNWAVRCMLEAKLHDHNWFLTLTYDDDHVPVVLSDVVDETTGEVFENDCFSYCLRKKHISDFLKRLRSYFNYHFNVTDIRFFACGEYGDITFRPHYHMILFGPDIPDLEFYKFQNGNSYFTSRIISELWSHGFVIIGDVSFQSCSYVARYCTKKTKIVDTSFYASHGIEPEFTLMSRRPGIARSYYDENSGRIYSADNLIVVGSNGKPLVVKPPRYFDKLFGVDDPYKFDLVKRVRVENSRQISRSVLSHTSVSADEYLAVQEQNKLAIIASLKRGAI